jgi:DNA repair protein RecO (recombination protein O)
MQWDDEALVLGARPYAETGVILDVLTREHGRRSGLIHGGASRSRRAQIEPANTVQLTWSARLDEQLGRFSPIEALTERAAFVLHTPDRLDALASLTALLRETLHEGDEPHGLYEATTLTADAITHSEVWPALYVRWELGLLGTLGFGLDLERCALSGANDGLTHVSPRTGRAVRGSEAGDYLDRLFRLPPFLMGVPGLPLPSEIADGLALTGHFLEHRALHAVHRTLPEARARLVDRLRER